MAYKDNRDEEKETLAEGVVDEVLDETDDEDETIPEPDAGVLGDENWE